MVNAYIQSMGLSKKTVGVIVILIAVALSGLVIVQSFLLISAFESKEQAFERNVTAALNVATHKLATTEMISIALTSDSLAENHGYASMVTIDCNDSIADSVIMIKQFIGKHDDSLRTDFWVENDSVHYQVPSAQHVRLHVSNPISGISAVIIDTMTAPGCYTVPLQDSAYGDGRFIWKYVTDSMAMIVQTDDGLPDGRLTESGDRDERQMLVRAVLSRLGQNELKPIAERLDRQELDSIVTFSLQQSGIELEHAYGVMATDIDSLLFAAPSEYSEPLKQSRFRVPLFPHDVFSEPTDLILHFPDHSVYLWRQMLPLVAPTVVLMLIIVGCFFYTIRTILSQRRFARLMVDFINNMTHEFKTPISTVQLASEAISRHDVIGDREKVDHFNRMILNESRRMRSQTDKILQMAVIEEGDYELKKEPIDIHRVIREATEAMTLHVENRQGKIESVLGAERSTMMADAIHFGSVIQNLLDNANKYSPEKPYIRVATFNADGYLIISVSDNGIGIKPEDQKMVFDKYFRVPRGNLHDVKGFGLGLSYVKLMTEAHGGLVSLESKPGEGTRVELKFPGTMVTG